LSHDARFAVVGAGPAGCATAAYLARAGEDVLLLDRDRTPRVAVGESLLPLAAEVNEDLGVSMDGFLVKRGAVFARGTEHTRFDFSEALRPRWPHAWQCPRDDLDTRLRAAADRAGAHLRITRVRAIDPDGAVHTDDGDLRAEVVVDAAGRGQLLARALGLHRGYPDLRHAARTAWFTGVRRLEGEQEGDIVIASCDAGWFWVIPFADGTTSVGLVGEGAALAGEGAVERAAARCGAVAERLHDAERVEPWRGTSDFTVGAQRLHGPGWALVGDAASFLDPVFSTGVTLALHSGRWLAEALIDGDLPGYETRLRDAIEAVLPAIRAFYDGSFLGVALSEAARARGGVRSAVVSLLSGDVFDPDFTPPRRIARRLGDLARRLEV